MWWENLGDVLKVVEILSGGYPRPIGRTGWVRGGSRAQWFHIYREHGSRSPGSRSPHTGSLRTIAPRPMVGCLTAEGSIPTASAGPGAISSHQSDAQLARRVYPDQSESPQ